MIWALQNDHQNLSFVKDINLLGQKMIRNSHKNGQLLACHFHFETLFTNIKGILSYLFWFIFSSENILFISVAKLLLQFNLDP